ncbi:MAG: T9SS type A sorting domain-containing protein [Bacteroidetes bacterium]|nr:T9SS type A sorting domain-containing protein [Bacteroidota bacterium]
MVIDNIAGKTETDNVLLSFENVKAIDVTNTALSIVSTNASIETPTGIQTITSNEFTISPNPVSGNEIHINTNESLLAIVLYNSYGEKVSFSHDLNTKTLILPELPMGQYLLQIQTNKGISSQKLVILGQ